MHRLSIAWPPVCEVCGHAILNLDTGLVVLSDEVKPEIERARFAVHEFCRSEEHSPCMDLRDFAKLVQRRERNDRFG